MRKNLFLVLLIGFALFNCSANIVVPKLNETVSALSFMPSALEELQEQGTYVLFDENGRPYGFVENGEFVDSIQYGNLQVLPYLGENSVVVGSSSIQSASESLAGLRKEQGEQVDWDILKETDYLKYAYYSQRYTNLEDFLKTGLNLDSKSKSIDFMNSLDPSIVGDLQSVFETAKEKTVGYSQYKELLEALNKINKEDLSKYLDQETLDKVNDALKNIKTDLAKDLLKNVLENIGKDELNLLFDLLKQLDYGTLFDIAKDYTRDLAKSGTLDKIGDTLKDSGVGKEIRDKFGDVTKSFLKNTLPDILPKHFVYYLLVIAVGIFTLVLRRVG